MGGSVSSGGDVDSGCVNKVILMGNLGRDPEVRQLASGESLVSLRLATNETWRDKETGERRERTQWHSVAIFNATLGRIAGQYLKKGSRVCCGPAAHAELAGPERREPQFYRSGPQRSRLRTCAVALRARAVGAL